MQTLLSVEINRRAALSLICQVASTHGLGCDQRVLSGVLPKAIRVGDVLATLASMGFLVRPAALDTEADSKLHATCQSLFLTQEGSGVPAELSLAVNSGAERKPEQLARWTVVRDERQRTPEDLEEPNDVGGTFNLRSVLRIVLARKAAWRDVLVASVAVQLVGLGIPLLTQTIFDKVVAHQTTATLTTIALALAVFAIFNAAMTWARQSVLLSVANEVDLNLGTHAIHHLFRLPSRFMERRSTGNTVARISGVQTIRAFLASAAIALVLDVPFLCLFVAIMFYYSVGLTVIALLFTCAIAIIAGAATPFLRERLDQQFKAAARTQSFATEHIAAFSTVKAMQLEAHVSRRHEQLLEHQIAAGQKAASVGIATAAGTGLVEQLMGFTVLVGGVLLVMENQGFSIGMLIAFQMFASRLGQPITRIAGLWSEFQEARLAIRRLADLMNAPAEPYALLTGSFETSDAKRGLVLEKVGFRYAQDGPSLFEGVDLSIRSGTTTVLVGSSGVGKSTIAKMLLGHLRPTSGRILIHGQDSRHLAANELRSRFGVVPQDVVLFSGTILENVLLGQPDASAEDAAEACRLAGIHDSIETMSSGYQTSLGEGGVGLSGGQRQRIAIARALIRSPDILIFDEATSGLDDATANVLGQTVNSLRERTAVLFITHKIPRTLKVDQLYRLGTAINAASDKSLNSDPESSSKGSLCHE